MGLFSFLGIGSRPAPTPIQSTASAATTPAAETSTRATTPTAPVAVNDTFEAAGEPAMCSLDGTGPNACFPEFAREGSGGGGKTGVVVDNG